MQKVIVAACGILLSVTLAFSFGATGGGSTVNNLTIFDQSAGCNTSGVVGAGVSDATGYTVAPTALTPGEKTFIQLVVGDSISANSGVAYTIVNTTKNQTFNIYNGGNYQSQSVALGASSGPGGYPARIADKLITAAKFARVITIDVSLGGHCSSDAAKPGGMNHRPRVACLMARSLGWPISGSGDSANWRMAILYAMGVNDNVKGVSAAAFTANSQSFFDSMRDYGCTGDVFVAKSTMNVNVVNPTLQAAQTGLVDSVTIIAGADRDALTGAGNGDGTHLTTAAGNDNYATDWANRFIARY